MISEAAFDLVAWEVGAISHRAVSGTVILLDEAGKPVNVEFSYPRGATTLVVPGDAPGAQWIREHGMKDATEMVREAFDAHRATL